MLAALTLEAGHEPLKFADVPGMAESWLLAAGVIAGVALVFTLLVRMLQGAGPGREEAGWSWGAVLGGVIVLGVLLARLPNALRLLGYWLGLADFPLDPAHPIAQGGKSIGSLAGSERVRLLLLQQWNVFLVLAGLAVAAVLVPMFLNLTRLSGRRIWALAKLSFKEAIRRRILWAFSLLLLVFLFASWFFTSKPEDQLRTYVNTVYTAMTVLLLLTAVLLAAFSLPADMRNQTIHTIVTKPVERFEIIVGRFLGYTFLMTLVLVVMTLFSLVYVARGIDPDAAEESYKARVPVLGDLQIVGGKNVGYEWDYRQYISGDTKEDYAVWTFRDLPRDLGNRGDPSVRCEFTFDIFRTTKGVENEGVFCSFIFLNWQCEPEDPAAAASTAQGVPVTLDQYRQEKNDLNLLLLAQNEGERNRLLRLAPNTPPAEVKEAIRNYLTDKYRIERYRYPQSPEQLREELDRLLARRPGADAQAVQLAIADYLAAKYHFHEILSKEIFDFHTLFVDLPAGLFRNMREWDLRKGPPLRVVVRCESKTQYVGVAKADLYLMDRVRGFEQNFFKGAVGLWYRLCLVIGVAVTCSTYLSGVISFLATMTLYLLGLITDFIQQVARHQALGGGPMEAFFRLVRREHPTMPLDQNPIVTVVQNLDKASEWVFKIILYIIPDVDRFDMTRFVAEGFDVSGTDLLLTGLLLVGYLLPWAVLAYYLMRAREVAA